MINNSEVITSAPTQSLSNKILVSPRIVGATRYDTSSIQFLTGASPAIPTDKSYILVSASNSYSYLPAISSQNSWTPINIKNFSGSDLIISGSFGQPIDGYGAITIRTFDSIQLIADPANSCWWTFNYSVGSPIIIT